MGPLKLLNSEGGIHIGRRGVSRKFLFFDFIALTEAFKHVHVDGNHKNL